MNAGNGAPPGAPNPTNERLASAMEFARIGCRVVICDGKNPGAHLGDEWQRQATRDEVILCEWWTRWPEGNVGILGDRAVAPLDVDDPASFERLQRETAPAPPTPRFFTGGAHPPGRERLLLAHPGDNTLGTELAPGVQFRRGSLMSLVPPSQHPETGLVAEYSIGPDEVPFAAVPAAWLERLHPRRTANGKPAGRPTSEWVEAFTTNIVSGNGVCHPKMVSMAGYLVRKLGSGRVALELLLCWNRAHCKPPKPEREIVELVAWTVKKEAGQR